MLADKAAVFVGPTLPRHLRIEDKRLVHLRPAERGDLYRAVAEGPRAIILIDGLFETCPSVFHKEILWALTAGVHVFGSSSIGALRSAELLPFGMVGHGAVFQAYRNGTLERDDAVAVLHAPEELNWQPLTEAHVDIEFTLGLAVHQNVINDDQKSKLLAISERLYWKNRTYQAVIAESSEILSRESAERLLRWLRKNRASQKTLDGVGACRHVLDCWDALEDPFVPSFDFQHSLAWKQARQEIEFENCGISSAQWEGIESGLRQDGIYSFIEREALALVLAKEIAGDVAERDLQAATERFLASKGIETAEDLGSWLSSRKLRPPDYISLVEHDERVTRLRRRRETSLSLAILLLLRERGLLDRYIGRCPPDR